MLATIITIRAAAKTPTPIATCKPCESAIKSYLKSMKSLLIANVTEQFTSTLNAYMHVCMSIGTRIKVVSYSHDLPFKFTYWISISIIWKPKYLGCLMDLECNTLVQLFRVAWHSRLLATGHVSGAFVATTYVWCILTCQRFRCNHPDIDRCRNNGCWWWQLYSHGQKRTCLQQHLVNKESVKSQNMC